MAAGETPQLCLPSVRCAARFTVWREGATECRAAETRHALRKRKAELEGRAGKERRGERFEPDRERDRRTREGGRLNSIDASSLSACLLPP